MKDEDAEDSGGSLGANGGGGGSGGLDSNNSKKELVDAEESSPAALTHPGTPVSTGNETAGSNPVATGGHHTMEFFEMCAALITQLAR